MSSAARRSHCSLAEALAPFPPHRRQLLPGRPPHHHASRMRDANAYVERDLPARPRSSSPERSTSTVSICVEASFSMVTTEAGRADPAAARAAFRFDRPEISCAAPLPARAAGSGTAFYRQRSTAIERVTDANLEHFVRTAQAEAAKLCPNSGYIHGSDDYLRADRRGRGRRRPADHLSGQPAPFGDHSARA